MAQQHGPNQESDLATLDTTLGVTLPVRSACVLTNDGDTEGSTAYYAFFPKQEDAFATMLKDTFARAGYRPTSDGNDYDGGAADGRVDIYPAGDENWSEYFGGAAIVLLAGQFDGTPGATAAPLPGAGSAPLTWQSSCMLSVAEVNAAWASKDVQFEGPAAADGDSTACEYSQVGEDLPIRADVDFRPYTPTGTYGWGTSGSSWTAPSAAVGASNACEAARSGTSTNGLQAICTKVGKAKVVIGADRLQALVFRPGGYFSVVDLTNVGGDNSLTMPLEAMTKLLASRGPVGS